MAKSTKAILLILGLIIAFSIIVGAIKTLNHPDNRIIYTDQKGKSTIIGVPNNAYLGSYWWEENKLIITFNEG